MSAHFHELPKPAGATGAGDPLRTDGFIDKAVQAKVSAGSVTLEGSDDGTNWIDVGGGAITGDAWRLVTPVVKFIRMNVTLAIGAGDKLILGGRTIP